MKFIKYLLIITAMLSINVAIAQSSDKGASIISQENIYDVPMPSWMQEDSNKNSGHKSNTANVINILLTFSDSFKEPMGN